LKQPHVSIVKRRKGIAVGVVLAALITASTGTYLYTREQAEPSSGIIAVQCGLAHRQVDETVATRTFEYTIRNCRDEKVRRKLDIADSNDGDCHSIDPQETVSARITIPVIASIRDMKAC
jgi:hypothetical protein